MKKTVKAIMVRKSSNIEDYYYMIKEFDYKECEVIVEKEIMLTEEEFKELTTDYFLYRDYITENIESMYYDKDIWHCILAKTKDSEIGILIESEGYSYARYTGILKIEKDSKDE